MRCSATASTSTTPTPTPSRTSRPWSRPPHSPPAPPAPRPDSRGAGGPQSVRGGKLGVYPPFRGAAGGEIDIDGRLAALGERWEPPRIAYKPFPVCHFMHGSLGAASDALRGRLLTAD